MDVVNKKESFGMSFYHLKEEANDYLAESIFIGKSPRSRLILELVKEAERIINTERAKITHPAYIPYQKTVYIDEQYCLVREGNEQLTPITVYLENNETSVEQVTDWLITIAEIGKEAEKQKINWPGFTLECFGVNDKGEIRVINPAIINLISKYRKEFNYLKVPETYQAPEMFEKNTWDEKARLYSWAIISYYLLTKEVPFRDDDKADLLEKILHDRPSQPRYINYKISNNLNQLLMSLLAKDRDKRLESWTELLTSLKEIKEKKKMLATKQEEKNNRQKANQAKKVEKIKQNFRLFFRRHWKKVAALVFIIFGLSYIGYISRQDPIVTEETSPLEVVQYFYQAIDEKDTFILEETADFDLGSMDRVLAQTYAMEKQRELQYMGTFQPVSSTEGRLFGILDLEIEDLSAETTRPTFKAEYIFFVNEPQEGLQKIPMNDTLILEQIKNRWQIVEFEGTLLYFMRGEISELYLEDDNKIDYNEE